MAQSLIDSQERLQKVHEIECLVHEVLDASECFTIKDLAVNGRDLIAVGMKPRKDIGEMLNILLDKVINNETPNTKEDVLSEVKYILDGEKSEFYRESLYRHK